ncbi:hypothetical protein M433DRAFT_138278 [Acidomyces richmondensis BFW]|nr:hypothetical protein M433DRAFT_138278 [Acidomyces richmondensis BFW]
MRRKPSPIGNGGIHQKVWDFMHPETRHMFNQIYPDNRNPQRSQAQFGVMDDRAIMDLEMSILNQFQVQSPHYICYRVIATDGSYPNHAGLRARAQSCFLAEIPAQKPVPETAPKLRLNVPEDLLIEAVSTYSKRLSRSRGQPDDDFVRD